MKKFGFGSMRLPCNSDDPKDIDMAQVDKANEYMNVLKDVRPELIK